MNKKMQLWAKTNRLLSKFADVVATSFTYTKYAPSSAVHTGIPLQKKKVKLERYIQQKKEFLLLVVVKVLQFFQDCSLITRILKQVFNKKNCYSSTSKN